jgi:hypothetical protein
MSNLSDLLPAGAGAKSATFTASGTLSSGQTVALKSDGTVSAVGGTPQELGSQATFASVTINNTSVTFDSSANKVVIAYTDDNNSSYGTAIVGTVSGTSISFGSPVVFESALSDYISATFDSSANKVVIAYTDAGNLSYGTAIVGTVSGTSISFGSPVIFESAQSNYISATFDSDSNKVVIAYRDGGNSNYGTAVVGTVSGTSISFGSPVVFESASSIYISATFDSTNAKVVIAYRDNGNSSYGTAIVGTVSGTSISFGSAAVFDSTDSTFISATFDSNENKAVIAYRDENNLDYGTAVVGTVSGTSISFGTPVVFDSTYATMLSASYYPPTNNIIIAYKDQTSNNGDLVVGTVSGTSISFDSPFTYNSGLTRYIGTGYDSTAEKIIIAYSDGLDVGAANTFSASSLNYTDFVGITDQAIADTATGSVVVAGGVSEKVSGLTTGSTYYVQDDGSLSTTASSVTAGKALSATKLLLRG